MYGIRQRRGRIRGEKFACTPHVPATKCLKKVWRSMYEVKVGLNLFPRAKIYWAFSTKRRSPQIWKTAYALIKSTMSRCWKTEAWSRKKSFLNGPCDSGLLSVKRKRHKTLFNPSGKMPRNGLILGEPNTRRCNLINMTKWSFSVWPCGDVASKKLYGEQYFKKSGDFCSNLTKPIYFDFWNLNFQLCIDFMVV